MMFSNIFLTLHLHHTRHLDTSATIVNHLFRTYVGAEMSFLSCNIKAAETMPESVSIRINVYFFFLFLSVHAINKVNNSLE